MASNYDFSGKRVLITGGTRGIGAALVHAFHEAGGRILLTGSDPRKLEELEQSNRGAGLTNIEYLHADFSIPTSLDTFLKNIEKMEELDICVNNAGMNRNNPLQTIETYDLDRILQINLRAPMLICRSLCPVMCKNPSGGRIVNVSSIWGLIAKAGRSSYGAAKAGLASFSRHIAVDLAPHNILVNTVSPGFTMTELTETMLTKDEIAELAAQVPLGRIADPSEIANVILFLCSDLNTFITGHNLVVDGGFTIV